MRRKYCKMCHVNTQLRASPLSLNGLCSYCQPRLKRFMKRVAELNARAPA